MVRLYLEKKHTLYSLWPIVVEDNGASFRELLAWDQRHSQRLKYNFKWRGCALIRHFTCHSVISHSYHTFPNELVEFPFICRALMRSILAYIISESLWIDECFYSCWVWEQRRVLKKEYTPNFNLEESLLTQCCSVNFPLIFLWRKLVRGSHSGTFLGNSVANNPVWSFE